MPSGSTESWRDALFEDLEPVVLGERLQLLDDVEVAEDLRELRAVVCAVQDVLKRGALHVA